MRPFISLILLVLASNQSLKSQVCFAPEITSNLLDNGGISLNEVNHHKLFSSDLPYGIYFISGWNEDCQISRKILLAP